MGTSRINLTLIKALLLAALAVPMALPSDAAAARTPADLLRSQVLRLHGRLTKMAMESSEVEEARAATARAFASFYQIRENILIELRKRDDYADLKLALWHQQQQLQGLHVEVPVKIANILATASDAMSIRSRIGQMETEALEANESYVAARDELNTLVAAERRAVADALDRVRTDPEFAALTQQLRSAQRSFSRRG